MPIASEGIAMVAETARITPSEKSIEWYYLMDVQCVFRAGVEGKPVPVKFKNAEASPQDKLLYWPIIATWNMSFDPGEKKRPINTGPGGMAYRETPDKVVITYWLEPGALRPREQGSRRGPLKNPVKRAFPQDSLPSMMRLTDGDKGQTGIFQGFHRGRTDSIKSITRSGALWDERDLTLYKEYPALRQKYLFLLENLEAAFAGTKFRDSGLDAFFRLTGWYIHGKTSLYSKRIKSIPQNKSSNTGMAFRSTPDLTCQGMASSFEYG
ncbi:MAG: hypothetical protein ACP5QG_04395 [candidate division WOR-3 bacterium]